MGRPIDQFDDVSSAIQLTDRVIGYRPGAKGCQIDLASLSNFLAVILSNAFANTAHTHTASQISDSTAAGQALLRAIDVVAQRAFLGLGTAATQDSATLLARENHTGVMSLLGLAQSGATVGDIATWDGTKWVPAQPGTIVPVVEDHVDYVYLLNPSTGDYIRISLSGLDSDPTVTFEDSGAGGNNSNTFDALWIRNGSTGDYIRFYVVGGSNSDPQMAWGPGTPSLSDTTFDQFFILNQTSNNYVEWVVSGDDSDPLITYRVEAGSDHLSQLYLLNPATGNYVEVQLSGSDDDPLVTYAPGGTGGSAANTFDSIWIRNGTTGNYVRLYVSGGTDDDPLMQWGIGSPPAGDNVFAQFYQANPSTGNFIEWVVSGDDSDPLVTYRPA